MKPSRRFEEKRRSVRIDTVLPFQIGHDDFDIQAETQNLSSHGAMAWTDRDIPMMTQLQIELTLPPDPSKSKNEKPRKLRLKGVVVRKEKDEARNRYSIAIFFSGISERNRDTIDRFIEHRLRKNA